MSVNGTINMNGTVVHTFSHSNGAVDLESLLENIAAAQADSNKFLTDYIDQHKPAAAGGKSGEQAADDEVDDIEEEDEDEDVATGAGAAAGNASSATNGSDDEPATKKPKL